MSELLREAILGTANSARADSSADKLIQQLPALDRERALLLCAGTLQGEIISSANILPNACFKGSFSVSLTGIKNCAINVRACTTDIAFGS